MLIFQKHTTIHVLKFSNSSLGGLVTAGAAFAGEAVLLGFILAGTVALKILHDLQQNIRVIYNEF